MQPPPRVPRPVQTPPSRNPYPNGKEFWMADAYRQKLGKTQQCKFGSAENINPTVTVVDRKDPIASDRVFVVVTMKNGIKSRVLNILKTNLMSIPETTGDANILRQKLVTEQKMVRNAKSLNLALRKLHQQNAVQDLRQKCEQHKKNINKNKQGIMTAQQAFNDQQSILDQLKLEKWVAKDNLAVAPWTLTKGGKTIKLDPLEKIFDQQIEHSTRVLEKDPKGWVLQKTVVSETRKKENTVTEDVVKRHKWWCTNAKNVLRAQEKETNLGLKMRVVGSNHARPARRIKVTVNGRRIRFGEFLHTILATAKKLFLVENKLTDEQLLEKIQIQVETAPGVWSGSWVRVDSREAREYYRG